MNTTRKLFGAALASVVLLGSACAPKVMTMNEIVGARSIKYVMQQAGTVGSGENTKNLYNFSVLVCDIDANDQESQCSESVVLTNVTTSPVN